MQLGIVLALVASVVTAARESIRKHVATDFTSVQMGYISQVYGVIILTPFAVWQFLVSNPVITLGVLFANLVSAVGVLLIVYFYIEALRITDISVTEPLKQTPPILVALLEPVLLKTLFSPLTVIAAFLGTVGAYILMAKNGYSKPIANFKNKGAMLALLVAVIYALISIAKRFGSTSINPLVFTYITYVMALTGFWIWKKIWGQEVKKESYFRKDVFAMGTVTALGAVITIYAFSLISASEVTVVKQTSGIFTILIGGRFFRETGIIRKLVGAAVIIAGVILVSI